MIAAPAGVKVLVVTKPVDFRRGADSLVALVREQLQHDPFLCGGRGYVAAPSGSA
jgi:transposase